MKKCLKIIAVVLILMTCLSGCANLNIKDWAVKKQAINYLCEKYDAEPDEFELVDYNKAHFCWLEKGFLSYELEYIDYSFEFKYNDRCFIVNRENHIFYDDYQFEDIELWCTEWLQDNINQSIVGFYLETDGILEYYKSTGKRYDYVLTKEDAEDFLKNHERIDIPEVYFHNDTNIGNNYGSDADLANEIKISLLLLENCNTHYSKNGYEKDFIISNYTEWKSYTLWN